MEPSLKENFSSSETVLVIGGAGFIGSHIVDSLLKNKSIKSVTILDSFFLGNNLNLQDALNFDSLKKLTILRGDASDVSTLLNIFIEKGITLVINLGVIPLISSLSQPFWSSKRNFEIALAACEAVRLNPIIRLVHFSSSEIYGNMRINPMNEDHPKNPETPYAAAKLSGDHMVLSYVNTFRIQATIIRPFNNYGPRQNVHHFSGIFPSIAKSILSKQPIQISGSGEQTRDFVHVLDTVQATLKIIECASFEGEVFNISTGVETSILDLAQRSLKILGIKKPQTHVIFTESRQADVSRHCGDASFLSNITGYSAKALSDDLISSTLLSLIEEMKAK